MSLRTPAVFLILLVAFTLDARLIQAQTLNRDLAAEGDTVWVLLNHVKPDKRDQFERFVEDIFWPEAKRLSEAEQRVFRQTRVLYPTEPETDGTYTYIFIMDPAIPGASYDIDAYLQKMYGTDKAEEYFRMFMDTISAPQTGYILVQSRF